MFQWLAIFYLQCISDCSKSNKKNKQPRSQKKHGNPGCVSIKGAKGKDQVVEEAFLWVAVLCRSHKVAQPWRVERQSVVVAAFNFMAQVVWPKNCGGYRSDCFSCWSVHCQISNLNQSICLLDGHRIAIKIIWNDALIRKSVSNLKSTLKVFLRFLIPLIWF